VAALEPDRELRLALDVMRARLPASILTGGISGAYVTPL
jgi:hypothetical protein